MNVFTTSQTVRLSSAKTEKTFVNLCHHKEDFNLYATWHVFATSHGKSACDGVGGILKRLNAKASLQRRFKNQILTPFELYAWACESLAQIKPMRVPKSPMLKLVEEQSSSFARAVRIIGPCSLHYIELLSPSVLRVGFMS